MPHPTRVRQMIANEGYTQSGTLTFTGDNTHSGDNTFSGTNSFSGASTFSGTIQPQLFEIDVHATDYTVTSADFGKILTTRGAGAKVTFTLPAASGNTGAWVLFINVADQDMQVDGQDEELVTFNDLTADSIAFSTASEKIGGMFLAVCDGTSWCVAPIATETQTVTIGSA